jgi:hypothetical protein
MRILVPRFTPRRPARQDLNPRPDGSFYFAAGLLFSRPSRLQVFCTAAQDLKLACFFYGVQ